MRVLEGLQCDNRKEYGPRANILGSKPYLFF